MPRIMAGSRTAATIDLGHDRASRERGQKVQCPMLVLWGEKGRIGEWYRPLDLWRSYCDAEVTGAAMPSGHYIAEEAPDEVLSAFQAFFG
jgi:haloacetate dehalogenase